MLPRLAIANDMVFMAEEEKTMQRLLNICCAETTRLGLCFNAVYSAHIDFSCRRLSISSELLPQWDGYCYLKSQALLKQAPSQSTRHTCRRLHCEVREFYDDAVSGDATQLQLLCNQVPLYQYQSAMKTPLLYLL